MNQEFFDPTDFGFAWTDAYHGTRDKSDWPIGPGWYEFDREAAIKAARRARDERAKHLKMLGHGVRKFTLSNQRRTMGGIGTGRPEIELVVPIYAIEHIPPVRVPIATGNGTTYWAKEPAKPPKAKRETQPALFDDERAIEAKGQGPDLFEPDRWVKEKKPVQKMLLTGLDCLPGQQDLFSCDGGPE
jgi:hypothetical protein